MFPNKELRRKNYTIDKRKARSGLLSWVESVDSRGQGGHWSISGLNRRGCSLMAKQYFQGFSNKARDYAK